MILIALTLAVWLTETLAGAIQAAGTALLTRHCRDQWAEQSASVICAKHIDFMSPNIPSWW